MWPCPLCSPHWPSQTCQGPPGLRGSVTTGWAYGDSLHPSLTFSGSSAGEGAPGAELSKEGWGGQSARKASDFHSSLTPFFMLPSSPTSCFSVGSPEEERLTWEQPTAPPDVFSGPARCPAPYTFSFEMLVTGPCLLAGGLSGLA